MNPFRPDRDPCGGALRRAFMAVTTALVVGCGGGGGGGNGGTPDPEPGQGELTGAWFYNGAGTGVRFDLVTHDETEVELNPNSTQAFGYGGGVISDVDEQVFTTANPDEYSVNLRNLEPDPYSIKTTLQTFTLGIIGGFVSGPIQPSPDATLFAMHTRESADLGEPYLDYVYVFDAALDVLFKLQGYLDPVWLGKDRLVVVAEEGNEGLFSITVEASPTVTQIGDTGLGMPGSAPMRPSVSPDGNTIAYVQGDIIWRIGVDGSGLTQLTLADIGTTWPTWSPDGSQLTVIDADCPPVGGGIPGGPEVAILSATATNQDVLSAPRVTRKIGAPVITCGPVYWLP
jgi:WD40-like Beta Propeller Repeat